MTVFVGIGIQLVPGTGWTGNSNGSPNQNILMDPEPSILSNCPKMCYFLVLCYLYLIPLT